MSGLTDFQVEVARLFFGLPASDGFLLAGGGALLASGLTDRPTHDLDFFGAPDDVDVTAARDQFEDVVTERGWRSERLHDSATFVRLHVTGAEELIVEFAIDSAAGRPPVTSIVGPTFDPEELAGRKLVALFSRAEARDFADVYAVTQRFDRTTLLARAHEFDPEFDHGVLAAMMSTLDRFADDELPIGSSNVTAVRSFFAEWARELSHQAERGV